MPKTIDDAVIRRIHRNLTAFGYDDLTVPEVTEAVERAKAGDVTDIIAMLARNMLVENGYIADEAT